jgi:hypothetical protein
MNALQIDDAILDFDDPRRSTHVLDAGDNPHCQHLAVSSGRQAQRRTFAPRKTTALAAFHPTRQAGRRGCQFPAARTWVRGACRDCRITFSPARRGLVLSLVWVPALRGRRLAGVAVGGHCSLLAGKCPQPRASVA